VPVTGTVAFARLVDFMEAMNELVNLEGTQLICQRILMPKATRQSGSRRLSPDSPSALVYSSVRSFPILITSIDSQWLNFLIN